jgi:hypothetical protein
MLPSQLIRTPKGVQVAKSLGVVYYRPSAIFLEDWDGACVECDIARGAGFQLVLTVRANGRLQATSPPSDLAAYQQALGRVLEVYRPAVLVVENEENSELFYTGTPEEYVAQLQAACQVAHREGIPCTNGGLVSTLVALLVYDHYVVSGRVKDAQEFAAKVFTPEEQRLLGTPKAHSQIEKGRLLLASYRGAGADYVNFHWYISDVHALKEAVTYLKEQTGLPAVTNEIGQHTDDPDQTTALMNMVVELGLPIAVWFSVDAVKARALTNIDGTLRPTGEAFKHFIETYFGSSQQPSEYSGKSFAPVGILAIIRGDFHDKDALVSMYNQYLTSAGNSSGIGVSFPGRSALNWVNRLEDIGKPVATMTSYFSIADIQANIDVDKSLGVEWIYYDLEAGLSPPEEVNNPVISINRAAAIVHEAGLKFAFTVVNIGRKPREIIPHVVGNADAYNPQGQTFLRQGGSVYAREVGEAMVLAKQYNPHIRLWAQLSIQQAGLETNQQALSDLVAYLGQHGYKLDAVTVFYGLDPTHVSLLDQFYRWFVKHYREDVNVNTARENSQNVELAKSTFSVLATGGLELLAADVSDHYGYSTKLRRKLLSR